MFSGLANEGCWKVYTAAMLAPGKICTRLIAVPAFPPFMHSTMGGSIIDGLVSEVRCRRQGGCDMIDTIRAFLYGILILVTALIPPVVSLMQQYKS